MNNSFGEEKRQRVEDLSQFVNGEREVVMGIRRVSNWIHASVTAVHGLVGHLARNC